VEPLLISDLQEITLDGEGYWVTATDLMGRVYRLEPQAALDIAVWVAKHHQEVELAQAELELVRRMEETIAYRHLLTPTADPGPAEPSPPAPEIPLRKRTRRSPRKNE
jgi:hypothetical protein